MFHLEVYDSIENTDGYLIKSQTEWRHDSVGNQGGWSTRKSLEGLKRRLIHAIMTEDTFVFALGGHSAAAGHGNMFLQSYTAQVQWILEAVFARLGVRHVAHNFANGGLGTYFKRQKKEDQHLENIITNLIIFLCVQSRYPPTWSCC